MDFLWHCKIGIFIASFFSWEYLLYIFFSPLTFLFIKKKIVILNCNAIVLGILLIIWLDATHAKINLIQDIYYRIITSKSFNDITINRFFYIFAYFAPYALLVASNKNLCILFCLLVLFYVFKDKRHTLCVPFSIF